MNPGYQSNPEPPYTSGKDYPSDAELAKRRELAQAGMHHVKELEEILDELGLYVVDLGPIVESLMGEL